MSWLSSFMSFLTTKPKTPAAASAAAAAAPAVPARPWRIGISPGHGGGDPGATGADGTTEAELARVLAKALQARMALSPIYAPALYGMDEVKKNYTQRVADSDANQDDFYIPIHLNASTNRGVNGWMVLVDPADVQKNPNLMGLASTIVLELQKFEALGFADYDTKKDGVQPGEDRPIYELTKPKADTLYLELGFISNIQWCARIKSEPGLPARIADAVVVGMDRFLAVAGGSFRK